jgi:hypothetical protein
MKTRRRFATLTAFPDSTVLAVGGENKSGALRTVEKLTQTGWTKVAELPYAVTHHCAVLYNSTTVEVRLR